ncbi:MAG: hypothetical protein ACLFTA_03100 [Candidatus Nanohaloarchaea archaeon]
MVEFKDGGFTKDDHLFVKEDPARIYRGIKDLLVNEFEMDRLEEGHNEFNVQKPKDKVRLHAYKEKSPHTLIHYDFQLRVKPPKTIYTMERPDDILKAKFAGSAEILTYYPGRNSTPWEPAPVTDNSIGGSNLMAEDPSTFQNSKLYKVLVSIWHDKFYSKQIHRYEEEAEETVLRVHDLLRQKFGVEKTIGASGRSHYRPNWG